MIKNLTYTVGLPLKVSSINFSRLLLIGLMLLGSSCICLAADTQPVFIIDASFKERSIAPQYLHVLPDAAKKFTIEAVKQETFLPLQQFPPPNKRTEGSIYWTKIIFHNQLELEQEYWLPILTLRSYGYLVRATGEMVQTQTGSSMPHKEKTVQTIKRKLANYLPIQLNAGEKATLYIKSEYGGHLPVLKEIDKLETPVYAELTVLKARSFQNLYTGFFQALLLILLLYCLFYAVYTKETFAFYLSAYCLAYCLYFLNVDGYLYEYTSLKNSPLLFNVFSLGLVNLTIIFESIFMQQYLSLNTRLPKWNSVLNGIIFIDIIIIGFTIAYFLLTKEFGFPLTIVSFFHLGWLIIRPFLLGSLWRIKDTKIRIFAFAWTIGLLFSVAAFMSYIIPGLNGAPFLKLAVGAYLLIMVIGLSYTAAKSRKDKLLFEEENRQKQLILVEQKHQQQEMEQDNKMLEIRAKELQSLNQLKSRFFANVSHELRTPLTLILGPLNSMLKSKSLDARNTKLAVLGKKNAKVLLQLVHEILDLNKIESGKLELETAPTLILPLLQQLSERFLGIAEQKNINFQLNIQISTDLEVELDAKKVEKVIANLLSNAFKFTPNGGQIRFQALHDEEYLRIKVKDNGSGITPYDLPLIFNRFFQSSLPNAPKKGGTGIGLSMALEFTKLMKGRIGVTSTLGKGSTFFFKVPIQIGKHLKASPVAPTIPAPSIPKKELLPAAVDFPNQATKTKEPAHLLLVEDNEDLNEYLQIILGDRYQITTAKNGKIAWQLLNNPQPTTRNPDLILSDIMMPEMDGYQLLDKLKGADRFRATPVIMLTALAELTNKLKALRIGVDDYITKPFEEAELIARIDNLLQNSRLRQEYYQQQKNDSVKQANSSNATVQHSQAEAEWLETLEAFIKSAMSDFEFTVEDLANQCAMSRRNLERKTKKLIGLTPAQYIQEIRYREARSLLESQTIKNIKEITAKVGLKDLANFSKNFKKRFGRLPSDYL